jgi:hypothetical protein
LSSGVCFVLCVVNVVVVKVCSNLYVGVCSLE